MKNAIQQLRTLSRSKVYQARIDAWIRKHVYHVQMSEQTTNRMEAEVENVKELVAERFKRRAGEALSEHNFMTQTQEKEFGGTTYRAEFLGIKE